MTLCKHKHTELDGTCMGCGLTEECRTIDSLRGQVKDLKARLKAVREDMKSVATVYGLKFHIPPRTVHALYLNRKNWREP